MQIAVPFPTGPNSLHLIIPSHDILGMMVLHAKGAGEELNLPTSCLYRTLPNAGVLLSLNYPSHSKLYSGTRRF